MLKLSKVNFNLEAVRYITIFARNRVKDENSNKKNTDLDKEYEAKKKEVEEFRNTWKKYNKSLYFGSHIIILPKKNKDKETPNEVKNPVQNNDKKSK